jgi:hypothetical protein
MVEGKAYPSGCIQPLLKLFQYRCIRNRPFPCTAHDRSWLLASTAGTCEGMPSLCWVVQDDRRLRNDNIFPPDIRNYRNHKISITSQIVVWKVKGTSRLTT